MKKALFTLLLVAATCSVAMAQNNSSRVLVSTDTVACESFQWSVNGQTYTSDTAVMQTNATNDTLFVLNLQVLHTAFVEETVSVDRCSYNWHGETYSTSGLYNDTVSGIGGCDSIFELILTVATAEMDSSTAHACGEYTWHDSTYIASGIYYDTTINATTNCTHIDKLNLNIVTQLDRYDTVSQCGDYTWHDSTYTEAGNYTYLFEDTVNLCDTLFHLNLAIVTNDIATVYDSACNSKTWRGQTFTETGVYYDYDTNNTTHCVTVRTLDLKIKPFRTPVKDTVMTGCNSIRFVVSTITGSTTKIFTESADFDTNIYNRNWAVCTDSTINLHVTVRYSSTVDTVAVACDSFLWDRNNKTYTANNEVKFTLPEKNQQNCDSILNLQLTVKKSPVIRAINGEWRLSEGDTARLYPTATAGSTYRWTVTPNRPTTMDGDTLVIPNVQGNIDVTLLATINYSDVNIACHDTSWITIVTYVGIDNVNSPSVTLFPNPTAGKLNIECAEAVSQVCVFNALGQQVVLAENLAAKSVMDLSTLSRGTYTMRITFANGESVIRKFVITK